MERKSINGWWFPADDIGQSQYASAEWGESILNQTLLEESEKIISRKSHAIDIGANIGYVTGWLSKRFKKVSAFEPTPATFECLNLNANRENIDLYNVGLSNENKNMFFAVNHLKPDLNQIISKNEIPKKGWGVTEIAVKTLDSYNFDLVDLIKIDVEGHEYQVLLGSEQTIKTYRPVIILEISYDGKLLDKDITANHHESLSLLESWGYTIKTRIRHDYILGHS